MADLILHNGKLATLDPQRPAARALAATDGRITAVGDDADIMPLRDDATTVIDLQGRTVIPGLNDSHTHVIRGGLFYNMELRWDGVPSLAEALRMLKTQAERTPAPQWVRVVGGWYEWQFAERRLPTLDEINAAAPETPVMVIHLYARAMINRAGLRALGIDRDTPNPKQGLIERDRHGNPTGMLIAEPNAYIVYSTIAQAPSLGYEDQLNSSRHFMRELNRLGVTSVIDAGGGGQNYPDDYKVIRDLHERDQLTLRFAYNLFAQKPGEELDDYRRWTDLTEPGEGDAWLRMNGAGENLVWSGADFENFLLPRPELDGVMEEDLEAVVRLLAEKRWPFRIHATYDETIGRFLDVFERVNRDIHFDGLRWFLDHAETIGERNIDRVAAMNGGIAVQHRMAYQGEYFIRRYGKAAAAQSPPVRRMLAAGIPVGGGSDATRVASYNPWVTLAWLVTGRTVGGTELYGDDNRLDRTEALRRLTEGSAWFSGEQDAKGRLTAGRFADLAVLSDDYFAVEPEAIKTLASVLTVVDGRIVHADGEFRDHGPDDLPVSPDWSPVAKFGGGHRDAGAQARQVHSHHHPHIHRVVSERGDWDLNCLCYV